MLSAHIQSMTFSTRSSSTWSSCGVICHSVLQLTVEWLSLAFDLLSSFMSNNNFPCCIPLTSVISHFPSLCIKVWLKLRIPIRDYNGEKPYIAFVYLPTSRHIQLTIVMCFYLCVLLILFAFPGAFFCQIPFVQFHFHICSFSGSCFIFSFDVKE